MYGEEEVCTGEGVEEGAAVQGMRESDDLEDCAVRVYYNENNPKTVAWLRELIRQGYLPAGDIDDRSIEQVQSNDLNNYEQHHFFAGIGGWAYALQLAHWTTKPVWTGSCPCQPFSCAGKGKGTADSRHLWPVWFKLIQQCKPSVVFGEQVASKAGLAWFTSLRSDLEASGYAVAATPLCAYAIGAPHERLRTFWVAHATGNGCQRLQRSAQTQVQENGPFKTLDAWHGTGHPFEQWPKLLAGTCVRKLDDGVSSELVIRPALRGFGNAIVPQLAALFIQASEEAMYG